MHAPAFAPGPTNAFLPLAPVADDAGRRAALATLLREGETAKAAEQALAGQVSVAVSHQREAAARLAAASAAVTDAKARAASATADWIRGEVGGDRPDTADVVAAQRIEALAAADAETINGAVEALRREMGKACQRATDAHAAARVAVQRIAMADAEALARHIVTRDAETMILRRRLLAFARQVGGGETVPPVIHEAANAQAPYGDWHSHLAVAEGKAWQDYREALTTDAGAQAGFPSV